MILKGEIKDAKMSSFSSDFQLNINFPLYYLYELLMNHCYELRLARSSISPGIFNRPKVKKKESTTENRREIDILHLEVPSTQTHLYTITFPISNN